RTLSEPAPDNPFDGAPEEIEAAVIEQVAALLSPTPTPRDELARALGLPIGTVAAALLELNLMGRADLLPGGLAAARSP
ncbi:MAG: DNA-protecting protein DprA, partial [Brevundimonas sp.]|nr:DNA-protecting protein DprA [Brevundimonas sp.]